MLDQPTHWFGTSLIPIAVASVSQSAGIMGVSHYVWFNFDLILPDRFALCVVHCDPIWCLVSYLVTAFPSKAFDI